MNKFRSSFVLLIRLLLVSCGKEMGYSYVKNIYFLGNDDSCQMVLQVYNFDSQQEDYTYTTVSSRDISDLVMKIVGRENYNFRLCENIIIDAKMFSGVLDDILTTANWLKIPPVTNVLCYIGTDVIENFNLTDAVNTPLYSLSQRNDGFSGLIQITGDRGQNEGAIIVENGNRLKAISADSWNILNMLKGNKNGFSITVTDENIFIYVDWCDVYYSADENLNIDITLSVKDYKGVDNTDDGMRKLHHKIRKEISDIIYKLYSDDIIREKCNLDWYADFYNAGTGEIEVNIKFL